MYKTRLYREILVVKQVMKKTHYQLIVFAKLILIINRLARARVKDDIIIIYILNASLFKMKHIEAKQVLSGNYREYAKWALLSVMHDTGIASSRYIDTISHYHKMSSPLPRRYHSMNVFETMIPHSIYDVNYSMKVSSIPKSQKLKICRDEVV